MFVLTLDSSKFPKNISTNIKSLYVYVSDIRRLRVATIGADLFRSIPNIDHMSKRY